MGGSISCVGRKDDPGSPTAVALRDSPFGKLKRSLSSRTSARTRALVAPCKRSLLDLVLGVVCENIQDVSPAALAALPADLAQLLLDRLIETGGLDEDTAARLWMLSHYRLHLPRYPGPVTDVWVTSLINITLESIDLDHSMVTDAGLLRLGHLPALRTLRLQHCQLLTSGFACVLARLPGLEELCLTGAESVRDATLEWVRACPNLRRLRLGRCRALTSLEPLRTLSRLEELDLGWCGEIGDRALAALRPLRSLRRLVLSGTAVTDVGLSGLGPFPELEELALCRTGARAAGLAGLRRRLPKLRSLDLARCAGVGVAAVQALCAAERGNTDASAQLESLDLSYTRITDGALVTLSGTLRTLRVLNLEACPVGDVGARALGALRRLEVLDLSDTAVGDVGVSDGVAGLPRLHTLLLAFTAITDEAVESLRTMKSLRRLDIDCRGVGDAACAAIGASLTELEALDLFGARVSDVGCAALAPLQALRSLEVCGGDVGDAGVERLAALQSLRRLSVAQNARISSRSLPALLRLKKLTALNLSHTSVGNQAISCLGQLPSLERLVLHGTRVKASGARRVQANLPGLVVVGVPGIEGPT